MSGLELIVCGSIDGWIIVMLCFYNLDLIKKCDHQDAVFILINYL